MDAGWGGQILVSEQIYNTCSLPSGAAWDDFGLQRVKSLDQPVHIYGLVHPDLPQRSFPPLRTLTNQAEPEPAISSKLRHNLEQQPTPFVGRRIELEALDDMLSNPEVRLITVVGPGGMGKTRLALATAENQLAGASDEYENPFPDGIFFVPLSSLNAPDQIAFMIGKAIDLPLESGQSTESLERTAQEQVSGSPWEKLLGYLQNKRALIILDNFEHILDGAEQLPEVLHAAPGVKILVTSRERLHLREEQVYPIQGLEYPDWEAPEDPWDYTAMELFMQSARRVQPDFELAPEEMVYLTRICQLVGGMPLGLELAASWVDMLSVADIAAEIQGSLDFLETDIRNIPDRHRSLRAVFDSSWGRLSEAEQRIFPRLTVFRSGFSRDVAQKISGATIRDLATLVSKSLVQYNNSTDCYQIHELLRQYGVKKLGENPVEESNTRDLHSAYYCDQVQKRFHTLMDGKPQLAFERFEVDIANIQTGWDWAIEKGSVQNIDKAVDGICWNFARNWQHKEGLDICQSVIERLAQMGVVHSSDVETSENMAFCQRLYAKALGWQGYYRLYFDHQKAAESLAQSKSIIDELVENGTNARYVETMVLYFQGSLEFLSGDLQEAKERHQESLSLSRELRLQTMIIFNLTALGEVAKTTGTPLEAQIWYEQSLTEARMQKNRWGEVIALSNLGWAARSLMDYDEAKNLFEQSLELSRLYHDQLGVMSALANLGFLAVLLGRFDEAIERFREGMAFSKDVGASQPAIDWQMHSGVAQWLNGDLEKAGAAFEETISISRQNLSYENVFSSVCYAEYLTIIGSYRQASEQLQIVKAYSQDVFLDRFMTGRLARVLGWVALAQGKYPEARSQFEKSIELYQLISDDEQIAWSQAGLARARMGLENWEEAHQLLQEALWTSIEIQGFIPLLFTLPITVLYLAHENPDEALTVYQDIQNSPFLANARFFEDIVYRFLPDEIITAPKERTIPEGDLRRHLWSTAASVLSDWIQVWMEEPEIIENEESM